MAKTKEKGRELILVVAREKLESFLNFYGFKPVQGEKPSQWADAGSYKIRENMETDPSFKQIIPYIVLRHGSNVFRYWRKNKSGESRLRHLYSIGVGGHINPHDDNLFPETDEALTEAALRELGEEILLDTKPELHLIGFINDDRSDVGRVHLGIVYEAWVHHEDIKIREDKALSKGKWIPIDKLNIGRIQYEAWSQFVIDDYLAAK